jgi:hypothetical protein
MMKKNKGEGMGIYRRKNVGKLSRIGIGILVPFRIRYFNQILIGFQLSYALRVCWPNSLPRGKGISIKRD